MIHSPSRGASRRLRQGPEPVLSSDRECCSYTTHLGTTRHFRWTESVVHGYNRSREEGALEPAMGEGLWCEGACKSRRLLCSKTRPPRVWARATKGRPSEHALTSSALRTRARGPIAAHPAPILGPPAPDRWPDPGHSYARARDMGLMPPYARPRAAREQLRTEFAQHAFRTTHVREGPIRRRLR